MRQVLVNDKGAVVARMPRPSVAPGTVLVRVEYSMISTGTELAGLRQTLSTESVSSLDKAKENSAIAIKYIGKALANPNKAKQRVQQLLAKHLSRIQFKRKESELTAVSAGPLTWQQCAAQQLTTSGDSLSIVTDNSAASYQIMSNPLVIPEGYAPQIDIQGEIKKGKISVGLLDENQSAWLGSKEFGPGPVDDLIIVPPYGSQKTTVVISNAGEGETALDLQSIKINMQPPSDDGLPHSELTQQGWNVGYSASGEVIAVGDGVTHVKPGDKVACGGAGKANHADYIVVPSNLVVRVPEGCELTAAASTTIGTIALQGVRRANPCLGEKVAVIGLGLLGQITCQLLKANGCRVYGLDLDTSRVEKAKQLGFNQCYSDSAEFTQVMHESTAAHGADITLITAATQSSAVVNHAMEITRRKGRVVLVGDVGLAIERAAFYKKEIDLLMSTSYGPGRYDSGYEEEGRDYPYPYVRWTLQRNMQAYLEFIADKKIDINALIERVILVNDAPEIYNELAVSKAPLPLGVLLAYPNEEQILPQPPDANLIQPKGHRKAQGDKTNYVLVGVGAFGTSMLVPQLEKQNKHFFMKGIVSRDTTRGGNYARQHGLELIATDLEHVVNRPDVDMLVIATRHCEHAQQVIQCLNAGKHVFVEKPLALTWDELEAVENCYHQLSAPSILAVGYNRRFSPAMRALQDVLAERRSPLVMQYRMNAGYIKPDHWVQTAQGGGRNLGEACHIYDCFRALAQAPINTIAASSIHPGDLPYFQNDNFIANLSYSDGSIASLTYTALGPKKGLPKERFEVFCDGEAYILDDYKTLTRASDGDVLWSGEVDKGHAYEMKLLAKAAANNQLPISVEELFETSAVALRVEDLLYGRD